MADGAGSLEAGEIPALRFSNDGSFFYNYVLGHAGGTAAPAERRDEQHQAGATNGHGRDSAMPVQAPELVAATAAAAAAAGGAQSEAGPVDPTHDAPTGSKPNKIILKAKRPIGKVQLRPGSKGGKRRSEGAAAEGGEGAPATGQQSFYLRELERYREQACDSSTGDRPLVK